jgi:hypothetical protein
VTGTYPGTIPVVRPNPNTGIGTIPPPSSAASEPPVPPAANLRPVTPQLPRTGNGSLAGPLDLAGLLLMSGVLAVRIARSRRSAMA